MSSVGDSVQRRPAVEMTADPCFACRVRRLAITSLVMLGLIWFVSRAMLDTLPAINVGLAAGWVLMPTLLGLSLRWPGVRYALIIPSSLISVSLFAICLTALPEGGVASTGWLLLTAGVLFGGVLGVWLWYRRFPVPNGLQDPFSSGRWTLIAVHIGLIVVGLAMVILSAII